MKPILAEFPKDNRLRAQKCYSELCKVAFIEAPSPNSPKKIPNEAVASRSDSDEDIGALTIDPGIEITTEEPPQDHE